MNSRRGVWIAVICSAVVVVLMASWTMVPPRYPVRYVTLGRRSR